MTLYHVTAVIGPYSSGLADAAAKAAEAVGVPLVTPSATAAVVTAGRPHIFRIAFTDAFQGMGKLSPTLEDFRQGAWRFAVGLAKKTLIAATLAPLADAAFAKAGGPDMAYLSPSLTRQNS